MNKAKRRLFQGASVAGWLIASTAGWAGATFGIGAEYTTGDYGTSRDTDIWYFPVTLGYETERNRVALTVPYVSVDGPGTAVPGPGRGAGVRSGFAPVDDRRRSGLGDILLEGSHNLVSESPDSARLDLTGKIKFGTAERDEVLGTGEDDVGVQLDAERNFGANGVFGTIGYLFTGEPPGTDYRNVAYGTLGAQHRFGGGTRFGAALDGQQAIARGTPSALEMRVFLSGRTDARTEVTGYALRGLRDGSPDWGAGVLVNWRL